MKIEKRIEPNSQGYLEINRYQVPYRIYGNNTKNTIICVNGAQQSMGVWRSIIEKFQNDFRIVVFDFPGQGRAKIIRGEPSVSFDDQILVLDHVINSTSANTDIYMIGASWGAIIVARYAELHPVIVKKIILGSLGAKLNKYIMDVMNEGRTLIDQGKFKEMGALIINGFGQLVPETLKEAIKKQFSNISEEHLRVLYAHSEFLERVGKISELVNPELINAYTLVINGEKDTIIDLSDNKEFTSKVPHCKTIVVKNAGHFLHFENPDIINYYVDFFYDK